MKRLCVLGLLVLAGCFNQPKYDRPAVELPPAWKESAPRFAADGRWWRIYDDSSLNAVIDEALTRNADLLVAAARVDEARVDDARVGVDVPGRIGAPIGGTVIHAMDDVRRISPDSTER